MEEYSVFEEFPAPSFPLSLTLRIFNVGMYEQYVIFKKYSLLVNDGCFYQITPLREWVFWEQFYTVFQ